MISRRAARLFGTLAFCLAASATTRAQETPLPTLTGRVVDEAGLLSPAEEARLEDFLGRLEAETSVQLVLVSVPRVEGAIEDFTLRLAEAWRIGQAETDSGALLVVSRDDRRARIEVGYGLEAVIPDGLAGRIIRDELAPRFADGDFAGGFSAAAAALAQAAAGEYRGRGAATGSRPRPRRGLSALVLVGLLVGLQLLGYVGNAFHPAGAAALGGGIAALLGLFLIGAGSLFWLTPLGLVAGFGATAFTRASAGRRSGWGSGGAPGGAGVLWGAPGLRGGFGGGGFSGFSGGGGSFGGGGASGSW